MPTRKRVEKLAAEWQRSFPRVPGITIESYLKRRGDEGYVLIDVRTPQEWGVSMIPNAITVEEYEANREAYRGRTVVVYCTIGWRSAVYVAQLRKAGIDALNLSTGVLGWALAGKEFVAPDGKQTRRVHVYAKRWNALPKGYQGVW